MNLYGLRGLPSCDFLVPTLYGSLSKLSAVLLQIGHAREIASYMVSPAGRNLTSHIWTERLTARSNVYFANMPDVRAFVAARARKRSVPTKNKPDKNR